MLRGGLRATDEIFDDARGTQAESLLVPSADSIDQLTVQADPAGRTRFRRHRGVISPGHAAQPAAPGINPAGTAHARWMRRYQILLVTSDFAAAGVAAVVAFVVRFGAPPTPTSTLHTELNAFFGMLVPFVWVCVIALNRAYEARYVGAGPAEFERVFRSFLHLTAIVAFFSYASKTELARGFIVIALPLALVLSLLGRYAGRKWLHRQRVGGQGLARVVAIGGADAVAEFTRLLSRDRYAGMQVVGACLPSELVGDSALNTLEQHGVPLLGDVDSVVGAVRSSRADTVAVLSGGISAEKLRWISWQLEGTDAVLVVSPGLTEVAGPRLHIRPVAGLPLLHVERPEFVGFRRVIKAVFDRSVATLAVVVLSPVLLGTALAVRLSTRGPALFRQVRVGIDGSAFTMLKFRSMYLDAEQRINELVSQNESADGLLFKIRNDPRITRVGRTIRRFSLDELPQLLNVIKGDMSLVGPRPPLPSEVALYGDDVRRRLLVKPGITGLWQISGRSDLAWEESIRLDLRYVENWSLATDLMILWKTAFAVVRSSGAY